MLSEIIKVEIEELNQSHLRHGQALTGLEQLLLAETPIPVSR